MQYCKRIFALTIIVVLVFVITAPCFSIGLALDAVDFWSIGWEMYCSQHGYRNYFTTNGTSNSMSNPAQKSVAQGMWEALYDEYREWDSNAPLMQNIGQVVYNGMTTNYTPVVGSETLYNLITLSSAVVGAYDSFANWFFDEKLGLTRDSNGNYHTSGSFSSPVVSSYTSYSTDGFTYVPVVSTLTSTEIINNGVSICTNSNGTAVNIAGTLIDNVFAFLYGTNGNYNIGVISTNDIDLDEVGISQTGWNGVAVFISNKHGDGYFCRYWVHEVTITSSANNIYVPIYNSVDDAISAFLDNVESGDDESINANIAVAPKEKVRNGDGSIYIPDVTDPNYIPEAIDFTTNEPYIDTDSKDNVLNKIMQKLLENTDPLELTDTLTPAPVINPYLPFTIPSFNFNFSGIWHYVISWVSSLGSGLAFFSNVWNHIPYAMVVPIYAAAVIVIVTSIFKRFV